MQIPTFSKSHLETLRFIGYGMGSSIGGCGGGGVGKNHSVTVPYAYGENISISGYAALNPSQGDLNRKEIVSMYF